MSPASRPKASEYNVEYYFGKRHFVLDSREDMGYGQIKPSGQNGGKKIYYEWMRCIACFLVIFNHLKGYTLFMNSTGIKQVIYMILSVFTKINVPLFFMVSGALLLERQEDFFTVFKKRISRICLVMLLFEFGIYVECHLYALVQGREHEFTLKRFLYGMFSGGLQETGAYWYLYAYLGFLLLLPMIQKIARQMSRQDFYTLLVLHFLVCTLLPVCNLFLQMTGRDEIVLAGEFSVALATLPAFFYPLEGYYIDHVIDIGSLSKRQWGTFMAVVFAGTALSCLCSFWDGAERGSFISLFDYLLAIAAFVVIKYIVVVRYPVLSTGKIAKAVCFMGSLTFGIYLLDHYFKLVLYQRYETFMERWLPSLFTSFGWCVTSMALGGFVTYILKKLPLLRELL